MLDERAVESASRSVGRTSRLVDGDVAQAAFQQREIFEPDGAIARRHRAAHGAGISTTMGRGVLTERLARSAERQRGSPAAPRPARRSWHRCRPRAPAHPAGQAIDLRLLKQEVVDLLASSRRKRRAAGACDAAQHRAGVDDEVVVAAVEPVEREDLELAEQACGPARRRRSR